DALVARLALPDGARRGEDVPRAGRELVGGGEARRVEADADSGGGLAGGVRDGGIEGDLAPVVGQELAEALPLDRARLEEELAQPLLQLGAEGRRPGAVPRQLLRLEDRVRVRALEEDRPARGTRKVLERAIDEREALRLGRPGRRVAPEAPVSGSQRGEQ